MVHCCVRESFAKNVCGEPRRPKRQNRPLSRGSQFVSGDLKSFVYTQLASKNINLLLGHEDFQRFQGNFLPDLNLSARKILKLYSDYPLSKSYRITAFNLKHWFNEHNLISIASVKSRHCSSTLQRQKMFNSSASPTPISLS